MKSYRNTETGRLYRTQAEAKASGRPFEPFDIPTDHAGLIAFANSLRANPPAPEPEFIEVEATEEHAGHGLNDVWAGDPIKVRNPAYTNGHPTRTFMKSRDPDAIFTCVECGHHNRNRFDEPR